MSIPGVFLFKLPTFKDTSSSLAIEINPISSSTGAVTKKRGVIIRSAPELEEITRLLLIQKLLSWQRTSMRSIHKKKLPLLRAVKIS